MNNQTFTRLVTAVGFAVDQEEARLKNVSEAQKALKVGDRVRYDGEDWTVRNLIPPAAGRFPQAQIIDTTPRKRVRVVPLKNVYPT